MSESQSTTQPEAWPRLIVAATLDDEAAGIVGEAAVSGGALGSCVGRDALDIYLPADATPGTIESVRAAVRDALAELGHAEAGITLDSIRDTGWSTAWREFFRPVAVGERWLIRPDWDRDVAPPEGMADRLPIWLNPGQGFGTGHHETTQLALSLVERYVNPGARVLDFGSGSAILSIGAVLMGARESVAVEYDVASHVNARENLALNDCADRVVLVEADTPPDEPEAFDVVVCNILPQHALRHLEGLRRALAPGATLIYSGFLSAGRDEVQAAATAAGLVIEAWCDRGEWGAMAARSA